MARTVRVSNWNIDTLTVTGHGAMRCAPSSTAQATGVASSSRSPAPLRLRKGAAVVCCRRVLDASAFCCPTPCRGGRMTTKLHTRKHIRMLSTFITTSVHSFEGTGFRSVREMVLVKHAPKTQYCSSHNSMQQTIALVTVLVRDYDEAIAYYTQTLGFRLLEDTTLGYEKRWVRVAPAGWWGATLPPPRT